MLDEQNQRSSTLQDYTSEIAKLQSEVESEKTKREHLELE